VVRDNKLEPDFVFKVGAGGSSLAQRAILGDISVYDCETGEEREVTVTERMLDQIAEAHREYDSAIQRFCTRSHVPYFAAPPDVPFDELVLRVLRRGGVLR
jgi:hypothetical protein